ncbi:Structural maintenance of chromosomes protein 6 [Nowakowskiella sp. JEL0078]|nr:Structural maintenance of chromosomes protein 6 [Nowakowskiella sp. JEL0078]
MDAYEFDPETQHDDIAEEEAEKSDVDDLNKENSLFPKQTRKRKSTSTNEPKSKSLKVKQNNMLRKLRPIVNENDEEDEDVGNVDVEEIEGDIKTKNLNRSQKGKQREGESLESEEETPKKGKSQNGAKGMGDDSVGFISQIELVNFMCHKFLIVDLEENINFIIGHNGSGKSAILTAITICLGGKASFTNRGNALRAFIKEGESVAQVTVTLTNSGFDAYKPELYGEKIIVERKLSRDGQGSYKIKSERHTISTKREELNNICETFQIQVDNPLAILTQDTARSFLATSSAKDKYNFFLKGTLLGELKEQYARLHDSLRVMNTNIDKSSEVR